MVHGRGQHNWRRANPRRRCCKNHYTASTTYKAAKNGYIVHVEYPETAFSEIQGGTNKEKVFSFLTEELGLNNAAACGVMANIQNESGFNPARHEDKNAYGDGLGEGYGLCQWSYSRKTSLLSFLQENGFAEDSIDGQLWFSRPKSNLRSVQRGTPSRTCLIHQMARMRLDACGA